MKGIEPIWAAGAGEWIPILVAILFFVVPAILKWLGQQGQKAQGGRGPRPAQPRLSSFAVAPA